jgi:hypothetical protein
MIINNVFLLEKICENDFPENLSPKTYPRKICTGNSFSWHFYGCELFPENIFFS